MGNRVVAKHAKNRKRRNTFFIKKVLVVILIIIAFFVFKSLFEKDELEGIWSIDGVTKYQFDGRGHGKMVLPSKEYTFSYSINNNEILIDFDGENSKDNSYRYTINGDMLQFNAISNEAFDFKMKHE